MGGFWSKSEGLGRLEGRGSSGAISGRTIGKGRIFEILGVFVEARADFCGFWGDFGRKMWVWADLKTVGRLVRFRVELLAKAEFLKFWVFL